MVHGSDGNVPEGTCKFMFSALERDGALPSLFLSIFATQHS